MWRIPLLIALLTLVLGAPTLGAATPPKTAITGFAPYILGMATREVLRADPELARGNYPTWTNTLLTQRYGRSIVAPIGGVNSIATLGLQFWQGRLAVVTLKWPTTAFDSASDWRHAAENLHRRITSTYANEVVKKHTVISASVWMIELVDAQGNEFSAWSGERPFDITMAYLWSPYAKALESAPVESNY
jgi:hypothetical protein